MTVLTLAVKDEKMRKVEERARKEERTREELVDEAIDFYLHEKFMDECRDQALKSGLAQGHTEESFMAMVEEEIHAVRAEKRNAGK